MSKDFIFQRLQWVEEEKKRLSEISQKEQVIEVSRSNIAEKRKWLEEQRDKATQLPEQERFQMTNDLIAERIDFFRKGLEDVAQLPSDQQETTHQFIQEKLQWLETQKERAAQIFSSKGTNAKE